MGTWKFAIRSNQFLCVFPAFLVFSFFLYQSLESKNDYIQSVSNLFRLSNSSFINEDWIKPTIQKSVMDKRVEIANETGNGFDLCSGKYVYVQNIPSKFNIEILEDCEIMQGWKDMCCHLSNEGLGVKFNEGWFATFHLSLEAIFHGRMKHYKCLTKNSSLASAIYVPFYPGLDFLRYIRGFNTSVRDSNSHSLVKWLRNTPEWKVLGGRDHFMAFGLITWEFRRKRNGSDWGTNLFLLPEAKNMIRVGIESNPLDFNEFAIPYPSYFHPSSDNEVFQWQSRMRRKEKKYLFCFAGAQRLAQVQSIRSQIIEQCQRSKGKCKLLSCDNSNGYKCFSSSNIMSLYQDSVFCLHPPGDSPTRKSAFDSILAGCIPVFFHPESAYLQYIFHMPQNYSKYSVYIPENEIRNGKVNIEAILSRISDEDVGAMREEVIQLISKLIYKHPEARMVRVEDAFDIAIKHVIQRVDEARKEMKNGRVSDRSPLKKLWKYKLWGRVKEHEWDHFYGISKPEDVDV